MTSLHIEACHLHLASACKYQHSKVLLQIEMVCHLLFGVTNGLYRGGIQSQRFNCKGAECFAGATLYQTDIFALCQLANALSKGYGLA